MIFEIEQLPQFLQTLKVYPVVDLRDLHEQMRYIAAGNQEQHLTMPLSDTILDLL